MPKNSKHELGVFRRAGVGVVKARRTALRNERYIVEVEKKLLSPSLQPVPKWKHDIRDRGVHSREVEAGGVEQSWIRIVVDGEITLTARICRQSRKSPQVVIGALLGT